MRKFLFIILFFSQQAIAGDILTMRGYVKDADIKVGDRVVSVDITTGARIVNTVMDTRVMTRQWYSLQDEGFEFYIINGKYKFFSGQSIYANGNVAHVSELKKGDRIFDTYGNIIVISKITRNDKQQKWFRFIISGNHSYVEDGILLHNASRFWVGAGLSANWSATGNTNWSATSGGSNNATVPGSSDDVTFDGAGGGNSASTISATITILSLTFTSGYTNTLTMNAVPTVAGNFTDNTAHSYAGVAALAISAASTITSNGKTFPTAITFSNANTKTISGNWIITGALTISAATVITSANTITCAGLSLTSASTTSGTCQIILSGGTWSGAGNINLSAGLTFAGNVTVSGTVAMTGGLLTWSSGTITTTGSTLAFNVGGPFTINTGGSPGVTWNNITIGIGSTYTINSLWTATGTMSIIGGISPTFAGTAGFTVNTLSCAATLAATITLVHSVTYTVTNALTANQSRLSTILLFTSDDGTVKAILILNNGATCNVLASFTRIDASAGRTIWTFNGTVTTCLNINQLTDLKTVSKTFVQ